MNKLTAGTAIVFDNTIQYGRLLPADLMFFESNHPYHESDAVVSDTNGGLFAVSRSAIRLATNEEIASGHRIDCEILDHPKDYTSPNCRKYQEQVK